MRYIFFFMSLLVMSSTWAQLSMPTYFVGEQKISPAISKKCFLELKYSSDQQLVELRSIVTNTHEGEWVPVGPLQAKYQFIAGSIKKNGYYFQDKTPKAPVKQLVLIAEDPQSPTSLLAAVFHEGHHDPVTCEATVVAVDAELAEAIELFSEFDHLDAEEHAH